MEETATYTQFIDQPVSQLNSKELLDLVKKNLKIFGEIEQKQFKRLESQLKYEKKIDDKEKEKRIIDERRQKELDELKEKNYKEEFNRVKDQKEKFEKLKSLSISDVIPSRLQEMGLSRFQQNQEEPNKAIFEKISSTLELIPEKIQKTVRKPQDEKGEQKNLGEEILRVSFHKEGIQILKTLLDPIYKALQANTELLDKMLDKITEGEKGSGIGWLALLAGAIFVLIEEIVKKIKRLGEIFETAKTRFFTWLDDLFKLPDKIREAFNNSKIVQFLKDKWAKIFDTVKDLGTYIKSYWDEFIVTPFKEKWASFMTKAKETIKFDELADAFKARWVNWTDKIKNLFNFEELTNKIDEAKSGLSSAWNRIKNILDGFSETLTRWYDKTKNIFDSLKVTFSEEGAIGKLFSKIKIAFEGLKTSFENVLKFLDPLWNALRQAGSFMKPVLKFLGWFLVILDPIIAAGKTLFNVWNNENLNFFEKSIAVLTSAFFGLGDGIASLIGIISEGVTGIWNLVTGKGWVTDNPVSNFFRGMTKDYSFGGMGESMGDTTVDVMEKGGDSVTFDRMKGLFGMETGAASAMTPYARKAQEFMEDGGISVEEQEYLDTKFNEQGQPVDDFIMQPKGISSLIIDKANNQTYQTAPNDEIIATKKGGILDQSLQDLKLIMSEVNKNILGLSKLKSSESPATIINNNTTTSRGEGTKEYLFKPMFDVNADKRASWWSMSREYDTAT